MAAELTVHHLPSPRSAVLKFVVKAVGLKIDYPRKLFVQEKPALLFVPVLKINMDLVISSIFPHMSYLPTVPNICHIMYIMNGNVSLSRVLLRSFAFLAKLQTA